jgi:phosphomannomutase
MTIFFLGFTMNSTDIEFIFDVDGTLTPSRQSIDPNFKQWFIDFCGVNSTYLVSGSDYIKTVEQLGEDICSLQKRIYSCSGNEVRENGRIISCSTWKPEPALVDFLNKQLNNSSFVIKTGNHIEYRTGSINYSTVGRNANLLERESYKQWDLAVRDRELLVKQLNSEFTNITAVIGGETGIDIYEKGSDKSQILRDFPNASALRFFADKTHPDGNDYTLAKQLPYVYTVKSWEETQEILLYFQDIKIAK